MARQKHSAAKFWFLMSSILFFSGSKSISLYRLFYMHIPPLDNSFMDYSLAFKTRNVVEYLMIFLGGFKALDVWQIFTKLMRLTFISQTCRVTLG